MVMQVGSTLILSGIQLHIKKSKLLLYQQDAKPIEKMMKLNYRHMPPNSMLLQYLVEMPPSPVPTMLLQGTV